MAKLPFERLRKAPINWLSALLMSEHNQTAAMVMAYLPPKRAAKMLLNWPEYEQWEIIRRICTIDTVDQDILRTVESTLEKKIKDVRMYMARGGSAHGAKMLFHMDPDQRQVIIDEMDDQDPELGQVLREELKKIPVPKKILHANRFLPDPPIDLDPDITKDPGLPE